MVIFFLLMERPFFTYGWKYHAEIVLLGWKMKSCALISHFTYKDFPLRPEPQCLGNLCCIDFKEEKLLSDSYTTSFISIQSRVGI